MHQLIYNMHVPKDLDNKVLDYIDPWGANLASIVWSIRASYHRTNGATPGQAVFYRGMIFNPAPVISWQCIPAKKQ